MRYRRGHARSTQAFDEKRMSEVADHMEHTSEPLSKDWLKKYSEMGFLGINVDEKYGGLGLSNLDALLVMEEFAKVSSAVAFPIFESCVGPVKAIEHFASEELKLKVIPEVCKGNIVVAVSMSEPNAGSALTDLTTKAEIKDNKFILQGISGIIVYKKNIKEFDEIKYQLLNKLKKSSRFSMVSESFYSTLLKRYSLSYENKNRPS